jgi:hypothetical protein
MCRMDLKTNLRNLRYRLSCGVLLAALSNTALVWAAAPFSTTSICIECHQKLK